MNTKYFTAILSLPVLAGVLFAQNPKTQALLMAMQANGKQMVTYQWKQRTTVIRKGNAAGVKIDEVRFDAAGQIQRITLAKPEERKLGPLMARKAARVKEDVQEVMQLAAMYANPLQLAQAIRKGEIWEGPGGLRVQARSVLLPTDEMQMMVNPATYLPVRVDFRTQFEGSPVTIAIDYNQLPNGPAMTTRMTVQIPNDGITVHVESYDFVRLAGHVIP